MFVDPRRCMSSGAICSKNNAIVLYHRRSRISRPMVPVLDYGSYSDKLFPLKTFCVKVPVSRSSSIPTTLLLYGMLVHRRVTSIAKSSGAANAATPAPINKYSSRYKQSCQFQIIHLLHGWPGLSPCSDLGKESRAEMQTESFS